MKNYVFKDFLIELYNISGNNFRVVTAQATYNNKDDFYSKYTFFDKSLEFC